MSGYRYSAVKQLSAKGLVNLQKTADSNREKTVCLTGRGKAFVGQTIKPLHDAEQSTFLQLISKESHTFLALQNTARKPLFLHISIPPSVPDRRLS